MGRAGPKIWQSALTFSGITKRTHKSEHVDVGRERRDDETVPSLVLLIQKGIDRVADEGGDCDV